MLKNRLADVCKSLPELENQEQVNVFDATVFNRLQAQEGSDADVKNSLKTIMRMLNAIYGKKVILLIDEYDVPLARASEKDTPENGYYTKMLDMIRGIMSTALKDNEFLQFAVITGCLRIAKESIFTGTNNFASYSVLDRQFSSYFGFTKEEVDKMLEAADMTEKADALHSSEDNLWSVLLMTGYVTKADATQDGETATKLTSDLLWDTISYNDYHEDYYHAFLTGILVGRGYSVESNKEKGLGRPDILLKDRRNRRALIIEAKKSKKEADMDKDCDEALDQIVTEKYAEGLYGYEQVICYGVAFFQKRAKVKLLEK